MGNFYLVRHGETFWNKNHIMHGQYDIPLDGNGIEQAKKLAIELKDKYFDVCFCSPLERARKTCIEILKYHRNTKVIYDDRLKEISKGLLEGQRSVNENILVGDNPYILDKYNVESKHEFFERVSSFMKDVQKEYLGKDVLIVCHSGTVKMCMFYLNPPKESISEAYYKLHIKNCSSSIVENKIPLTRLEGYNTKGVNKMKIGIYPMVADVLHTGHIVAIEEAKKHCDYLIVALHCCPNYKTPIQTIYERFMQLRAVKWVDEIIPYSNVDDARNMLLSLDYDVYFLGDDHKGSSWECEDVVNELNKEIFYLNRKHPYSSSYFKDEIIQNHDALLHK